MDDLRPADGEKARLGLMRNGAGNQRFSASRRSVEEHPFGRVNPQSLENLGVTEGQFDHFADSEEMGFQPANVLIRNRARRGLLGLAAFSDHQHSVGNNQHVTLGDGPIHFEVRPSRSKECGANTVPLEGRQAVEAAADVIQIPLRGSGVGRDQHDPLRRRTAHGSHLHILIEPCPGIISTEPIELNPGLLAHLLVGRHGLADRLPLAGHFDNVAHLHAKLRQILRPDACVGASDVLAQRFGNS